MKITIFWTWYVWLVTWTCLAEVWHEVMCIDVDENKIKNLKKWIIPIYEPWLEDLVLRNYREERLKFSTNAEKWIKFWKAIFSAVWTPADENHKADLKFVKEVAKTFWKHLEEDEYKVFINKSTVPVWTWDICEKIINEQLEKRNSKNCSFDIVSNPEFLKEWIAVRDFMLPDRIVCGIENKRAEDVMNVIYKPFLRANRPIIFTSIKSAEIIKYASNAFLATKISFINEVANFAEIVWANISEISKWMWLDDRIWSRFLHAWIGYGWSCLPKDVQAFVETWKEFNYDFKIIRATEEVNKIQKNKVIEKLKRKIIDLKWKTVSIWGLSFKPKTDDIREAPSIEVIKSLLNLWVEKIKCFDPVSMDNMKNIFQDNKKIHFSENNYDAIKKSDALILLTEWDEFRIINFDKMKKLMDWNIIIDWRNVWDKSEMINLGFDYEWIGK